MGLWILRKAESSTCSISSKPRNTLFSARTAALTTHQLTHTTPLTNRRQIAQSVQETNNYDVLATLLNCREYERKF
jgi:hypothetical protein